MEQTTIAAISTPRGTGGISIVRMSGPESSAIAGRIFRSHSGKSTVKMPGYTGTLGMLFDGDAHVDEAIAFIYRAPKSYTGEDMVELSCHGGNWVAEKTLRLCLDSGAVAAEPGEFTRRAFLNGKIDLMQAESVMDIISAEGAGALQAALSMSKGAVSTKIKDIVESLVGLAAHLTAWSDYPEEDIIDVDITSLSESLGRSQSQIKAMLDTFDSGHILSSGIRTVIAGKPNVGKSTLMNLLSGRQSSIVTEIPGTTRDVVSETVRIGQMVLKLYDTAGLRDSDDHVEMLGIERAKEEIYQAQLILAVFDYSSPLEPEDKDLLAKIGDKPCIALINKADLPCRINLEEIRECVGDIIILSAVTGEGSEQLANMIEKTLRITKITPDMAVISNERQRQNLIGAKTSVSHALEALMSGMTLDAVAVCIDEALDFLLRMTGEKVSDRVLDEVFSRFCVGK